MLTRAAAARDPAWPVIKRAAALVDVVARPHVRVRIEFTDGRLFDIRREGMAGILDSMLATGTAIRRVSLVNNRLPAATVIVLFDRSPDNAGRVAAEMRDGAQRLARRVIRDAAVHASLNPDTRLGRKHLAGVKRRFDSMKGG